ALKPYRDQILIATKVRGRTGGGINEIGLSRHHIESATRKSLERLGTSWVDLYQFHSCDSHVPLDESLAAMQELVDRRHVPYPEAHNLTAVHMSTSPGI